jgi:hypothetical protein
MSDGTSDIVIKTNAPMMVSKLFEVTGPVGPVAPVVQFIFSIEP